jgi:small GTP-binding protein
MPPMERTMRILDERQNLLLKEERKLLNDLWKALHAFGVDPGDAAAIEQALQQLDELFLLVVVGEFNAGKSALINALLGQALLQEGVTPTTTQINILRYGPERERSVVEEDTYVLTFPQDMLSEISIVDTPGTNAVIREHEVITSQFVPRSDVVLFVTSADRSFTESERAFLERIRDWGKKVVIVINKVDILENDEDLAQVEAFVAEHAHKLLGIVPDIFSVSARLALRAKQGSPALWAQSRFEPLERYIHDTLDEKGRIQLKLLNPLGVCAHLASSYLARIAARQEVIQADLTLLEDVRVQLAMYKEDMLRDFRFRMAGIENLLFEMEERGQVFFEDTFRLARVFDLLNKDRLQQAFEHRVVADVPQRIEAQVDELIDWLVDADLKQWQAVTEYLAERRRKHHSRIVGDLSAGGFHYDRERLIDAVGREALRVVETYDKTEEAKAMAASAQMAVAASAATEVGAVGLGALITVLATTLSLDVTGILMASVVAVLGFFIIPARRRRALEDMRNKIAELRTSLARTLQAQFAQEIDHSLQRINEAIAPYTRFVRAEHDKLLSAQADLNQIGQRERRLRMDVEEL